MGRVHFVWQDLHDVTSQTGRSLCLLVRPREYPQLPWILTKL
jgi:hypothetical protein